jgi:two-component system, NtrC family, nitrogen regulation sensor histidine kinase GlnL
MFSSKQFDRLSTALVVLNQDLGILDLNLAAEKLLGFSARQFYRKSLFDVVEIDINQVMLKQLSQQQQTSFVEAAQIHTYKGLLLANLMISSFEELDQGKASHYILLEIQSDPQHSHRRKDLELQQQSRISNHLIRNLAHEIKNPLGGIKGAAQLLQRKLDKIAQSTTPSELHAEKLQTTNLADSRYFEIIIQEADRLSELVNRLLLPAKPEQKSQANIHLLIEKALDIVLLQSKRSPKIIKDYDPSLPDVYICAQQIQQCLLNLIKNAAEAIDEEGHIHIKTRILHQHTIGNQQHKQVLLVEIIDNGCGIDHKLIGEIFFPTISGKNSSGLGLSIAQSLAQIHNGIIEVDSQINKTSFSLLLPILKPKTVDIEKLIAT